jgi:Calx-beta domain
MPRKSCRSAAQPGRTFFKTRPTEVDTTEIVALNTSNRVIRILAVLCATCALLVLPSSASAAPKKVQLSFSSVVYSAAETAGTFNVTVKRGGNTRVAASVQYSDNGTGTAVGGGVNYSFSSGTLNFAPGETSKTFPVTIVNNATANAPNKTIVFKLANATPAGTQIKTTTSTLTIIDDEGPGTLDFSSSAYTVVEGAGRATVTVNRVAGASNLRLSVDYATQASPTSPASPIFDYTPISPSRTLTFEPGELSKTFQVDIADDSLAEPAEKVRLVLSNPANLSGGAAPQIGPSQPAELTINDDDVSTFEFSAASYSVNENDAAGHATITVNRGGATNVPASVDYATSDGTAIGADYTSAAGTLNFAAGETTKTFNVDVTNDGTAEANETVNLTLTSGGATVDTALLSIVDNDNPKASIQVSSPSYDVGEPDGTASVTVTLSHPVDVDVTVDYATADGTATAGSDYTAASGTLTFIGNVNNGGPGTGQTSKTVQIPITQDPDPEDPENLTFTVSNALPGASALLGAPASATVTIADDDPPGFIDFKSLRYDVNETDGLASVTVERSDGVGGPVSVDYSTADGSASAGSDYTAVSGTLNWADGDSADKTFTVPVTWDGRGEGPESVSLALTTPSGGAELGSNASAVLRIADDGASGALAMSAAAYSITESDGIVTITVNRPGGSLGGPVTVGYATVDGTAAAGSDYTAVSGTVTFDPGEATKTFTVPVTSDSVVEADESFQVALSNATGGANVGSPAGATVSITNDDASPAGGTTPDGTAPKLTLAAKRVQSALKTKALTLSARCDEQCSLRAVAKVKIGRRNVVLGRARATGASGRAARMKLKLSRKSLARLRKAMKRGKARVVLTVSASDAAGNAAVGSRKVTAKR